MLSILKQKKQSNISDAKMNLKNADYKNSSYLYSTGAPIWSERNYEQFAGSAYVKNVIAYRAINIVAQTAASIPLKLYEIKNGVKHHNESHHALKLLKCPHPLKTGVELLSEIYIYRQINGNAYLLAVGDKSTSLEIHSLRPDRVSVLAGNSLIPFGYRYSISGKSNDYYIDQINGKSEILHIKNFHPLSDWYGLSAIEAAAYSIDQHNQAGAWNQALLQNGARPSGVVVVKDSEGRPSTLTNEQFTRVKAMIDEAFSGATNAGRPILLEGGLEWHEMSLSPKDMDFISAKHSSARDIALAFGVPPQLLGIPGDNTYSNLKEARVALWEQTIIPLVDNTLNHITRWLKTIFQEDFEITYDADKIPALSASRQAFWERIDKIQFLTDDEKRSIVGMGTS